MNVIQEFGFISPSDFIKLERKEKALLVAILEYLAKKQKEMQSKYKL